MFVQKPYEFLDSFCEAIAHSRNRVYLQSMVVEAGRVMDRVAPLLCSAAARGVDVRVFYDWVTNRYLHGDIRFLPTFNFERRACERVQHARNSDLFAYLARCGVVVVETNIPFARFHLFPVMGRNHRKIYIVDNLAWLGGVNFFDASFETIDFMVRFDDCVLVDELSRQCILVNESRVFADSVFPISHLGMLFVDAGRRGFSLIYEHALDLVRNATTSVIFISQLVPENRMLDLLFVKAQAGIRVVIITSHKHDAAFTRYPLRYFYLAFRRKLRSMPHGVQVFHVNGKVHAKLLIVDGREVFFGSHNFVESGIQMGTQEIAFCSKHAGLVSQLVDFADFLY